MPKLHGDANVRVNIDANGGVNNSDANVEAEIEALVKVGCSSTGLEEG